MNINFQQRVCSLLSCCWQKPRRRKKLYTNWKGRREKLNLCIHTHNRQTDGSPKWKSERSHKFPSTLNTQNILCCVCRSKLVFVSNLGLVFDVCRVHPRRRGVFDDGKLSPLRRETKLIFRNAKVDAFSFFRDFCDNSKQLVWQTS